MADAQRNIIIETNIDAPIEKVWKAWITPEDIVKWNNASDDWFTPSADNDLKEGGEFMYRMEAKDGSFGFDFSGKYNKIKEQELLEYILADDRKATVAFSEKDGKTTVTQTFEPEPETDNDIETQKAGWQAILDNFKKYVDEQ